MISAAMPQRSSASAGMLPLPRVSAMIFALYLPASSIIGNRSGSFEVELMIGTPHLLLCALSPASMALMFVVSRQSGFSTTSCSTFTAQSMSWGPFSSAGPMEMSIKCAPALACATASSWSGLGSNLVRASRTFFAITLIFSPIIIMFWKISFRIYKRVKQQGARNCAAFSWTLVP